MNKTTTNNTAVWQTYDREHHLHPFTDTKELAEKGCRVITRADGVYIWDSEGQRLLDGMAGLWCVNVGYGRKELADAAYKQLLEFSEANDTIIRLVRRYWDLAEKPEKSIIISRFDAYHGSTIGATSLGGLTAMHEQAHLPIPGITHINPPYWYRDGGDLTPEQFGLETARLLEERINELGADKIAAFIGEPIQGAGGVIIPPETYWPEIQRICNEYDILLIADEVICGFGRLGTWFGSDYYQIKPDLMPIAKGLSSGYMPIGGVIVGDRVADLLIAEGEEFAHGFTYSGHPVACAVAMENINILRNENMIENVGNNTGPYFQNRIRELSDHPLVGEARGVGLIGALELVKNKETRERFEPLGDVGGMCRNYVCVEIIVLTMD